MVPWNVGCWRRPMFKNVG